MARTSEERTELLRRANEVLERREREIAEARAEDKIIRDGLKSKYNLKSIPAARKGLEERKEEHEALVEESEEVMDKLEEALEELDE